MFYNPFRTASFEWNEEKNRRNLEIHGICFEDAQRAFLDSNALIFEDLTHSSNEARYFSYGEIDGVVVTVRFTYRGDKIRIFGAGYWRKGKKLYEEKNCLY